MGRCDPGLGQRRFRGACVALAAAVLLHAAAASAAGVCTAAGAGALQGAQGLVSALVSGLLGAAAGLRDGLVGSLPARLALACMPAEPASLSGADLPQTAGNPADLTTGAKLDRAVDLHIPVTESLPALRLGAPLELVFSRIYSSEFAAAGPLGPGWRHGFETRLHADTGPDGLRRMQVLQADGRVVHFGEAVPVAGGVSRRIALRRDDGVLDTLPLPPAGDGQAAAPGAGSRARFVWRWRDGRQLHFADDGRLLLLTDGAQRIVLHYEGAPARLASVADSAGRRVRLHYTDEGRRSPWSGSGARSAVRLAALERPDGRRIEYHHDARGRLVLVRQPEGDEVRYRYAGREAAGNAATARAMLSAVVLPDGRDSEYRYDEQGRVVHSRAAGVPEAQALQFAYPGDALPGAAGETQVSRGGVVLASYRWRVDVDGVTRRLTEGQGPGCDACPPVGVRYRHHDGRLAEVQAGGRWWRLSYDRQGRLAAVESAASGLGPAGLGGVGTSAEDLRAIGASTSDVSAHFGVDGLHPVRWLRIDWADDPVLDRPMRLRRPSVVPGREHLLEIAYGRDLQPQTLHEHGYAPAVARVQGRVQVTGGVRIRRALQAGALPPGLGGALALPPEARPEPDGSWMHRAGNGALTRYWLDDFGRMVASDSPDSGLTRWRRDGDGRVLTETVADGATARHRYDATGRLTGHEVSRSGAAPVSTRFLHAGGRLAAVTHPLQSERYAYDDAGRLVRRTVRLHLATGREAAFDTHYRYHAGEHHPRAWSLPDGSWLHLVRDDAGQVVAVDLERAASAAAKPQRLRLVGALEGGPSGLRHAELGNGARISIMRDPAGRPRRLCDRGPSAAPGRCDLLDHRLGFDAHGRLLGWIRGEERSLHLYDRAGRLVQALGRGPGGETVWRRAYDANGNPLGDGAAARLAGVLPDAPFAYRPDARGMRSNRVALAAAPASGAAVVPDDASDPGAPISADSGAPIAWDAAGRLLRDARRRYRWNSMGLLAEVRDRSGALLAAYRYNHRGERIATQTGGRWRYHLFDEQRRQLAELDEQGRVLRIHLHLGERPLAVVDLASGAARVAWLHLDHRGAPVAASGARGEILWQVAHAPFGRVVRQEGQPGFDPMLRLPGQWEDSATGLYYNDHRWYDPDSGRYLSPDPLGLRGGPNPYAYAGNDPLTRIDPSGLLLFAFDGTGNSDPPARLDDWSNVYKLARAYADGRVWYMAGVGRSDAASGIRAGAIDLVDARTARTRVDHMLEQLTRTVSAPESAGRWLDVDVIGFSRGAAMARDFANRVAQRIDSGAWERLGACVRLRFLGLWDTVAQFGIGGILDAAWDLAVPTQVAYAAHAVALNEHRTLFPAESIAGSPLGGVRIERGFIGAHSDIGGSYAEGDLSDVALAWMHSQARSAGVRMFALTSEFERVSSPLLHDSNLDRIGDRDFHKRNALGIALWSRPQRIAPVAGMQWRDTLGFITRFDAPMNDAYGEPTLVGTVQMQAYSEWLASNYGFTVGGEP